MLIPTLITSLASLFGNAAASPPIERREEVVPKPNTNIQITNLTVNDTLIGATFLQFDVFDPVPLANQTIGKCAGNWTHALNDWPVSAHALRCNQSSTISWYIDSWDSALSFVVNVQDRFQNDAVGGRMTTFSKFTANATFINYTSIVDPMYGTQFNNTIIYAHQYAVST